MEFADGLSDRRHTLFQVRQGYSIGTSFRLRISKLASLSSPRMCAKLRAGAAVDAVSCWFGDDSGATLACCCATLEDL